MTLRAWRASEDEETRRRRDEETRVESGVASQAAPRLLPHFHALHDTTGDAAENFLDHACRHRLERRHGVFERAAAVGILRLPEVLPPREEPPKLCLAGRPRRV